MNFLKNHDSFSSPIGLNISRGKKNQEHVESYSSNFGGLLTLLCWSMGLTFFVYLIMRMYALEDDKYSSQVMMNSMEGEDMLLDL